MADKKKYFNIIIKKKYKIIILKIKKKYIYKNKWIFKFRYFQYYYYKNISIYNFI